MKIGLVLAGGGARGAYQIGVIKALRELSIDKYIKVVSGTSIGALNAMLFMSGDLDRAVEIWNSISKKEILPTGTSNLIIRSRLLEIGIKNIDFIKKYMPKIIAGGNISRDGLISIMDKIDFSFVKTSGITCYVACTEMKELTAKYFKINNYEEEDIKKILLATSAIPIIYDYEEIDSFKYLDGGIVDNVPMKPVYEEKCDIIIVVNLAKDINVDKSLLPNSYIIEINPTIVEEGVFEGTLEFNRYMSKKRMEIGYKDTIEMIKPIMALTRFIDKDINKEGENTISFKNKIKNIIKGL